MQFLIDTNVLIWYLEDNPQLTSTAAEILEDTRHDLYVSIASLWEIAIKSGLGKLKLKIEFHDLKNLLKRFSIEIVSIDFEDTQTYLTLPFLDNHRDPFDRILAAQVTARSMILMSVDKNLICMRFSEYGNKTSKSSYKIPKSIAPSQTQLENLAVDRSPTDCVNALPQSLIHNPR